MVCPVRLASVLLLALSLAIIPLTLPIFPAGGGGVSEVPSENALPGRITLGAALDEAGLSWGILPGGGVAEGAVLEAGIAGDVIRGSVASIDARTDVVAPETPSQAPSAFLHLRPPDLRVPDGGVTPEGFVPAAATGAGAGAQDVTLEGPAGSDVALASPGSLHLLFSDLPLPVSLPVSDSVPVSTDQAPSTDVPATPTFHTVVSGDTLWQISRTARVSLAALVAANRICEGETLHPGQVLVVPVPGSSGADAPSGPSLSCPPPSQAHRVIAPRRRVELAVELGSPEHPEGLAVAADMTWPSYGTVTSRFGWRIHPIFGTREFHTGVDIGTRWGSPVVAARSGIIRFVGWKAGYGRLIVVDHGDGFETDYSHLSVVLVQAGERVIEGQIIGRVGSTGWSTGPHLFFEVRRNGVPLDPFRYLH